MDDTKKKKDDLVEMLRDVDVSNVESKALAKAASEHKKPMASKEKEGCWLKSYSKFIGSK